MLYSSQEKLDEILVDLLSKKSGCSGPELLKDLAKQGFIFTKQALYKELRKLQKLGVVVKAEGKFSLSVSWVLHIAAFMQRLESNYLKSGHISYLMPLEGQKTSWTFPELRILDFFWVHLIISLFRESQSKLMYQWLPHPWFDLIHPQLEPHFQESMSIVQGKIFMMIGGDTFLDRSYSKNLPKKFCEASHSEGPFESERSNYFQIIADYVLTVKLDKKSTQAIEDLYDTTLSPKDIDIKKIVSIFTRKSRSRIVLENSPKKAKRLARKFDQYFGLVW